MKIPDYDKANECIDKTLEIMPEDEFANSIKEKITAAKENKPVINKQSNLKFNLVLVAVCLAVGVVIGSIIAILLC